MARPSGRGRRPKGHVDEAQIKCDYLDRALTVREVWTRHGIGMNLMYKVLDRLGVPRRDAPDFDLYVLSQRGGESA